MHTNIELLNEKGLELVELKKALQTKNELVRNPLKESVKVMKLKNAIKLSLLDDISIEQFVERLVKEKPFVNQEKLHEQYGQFTEALEKHLNRRNIPVQYDIDSTGGLSVVKRFGAKEDFAKRYFKMTDTEFEEMKKSGFIATYMEKLALAMKRDLDEKIVSFEKKTNMKQKKTLKTKSSKVYFDATTGYYNVDIRIALVDYKTLNESHVALDVSSDIKDILEALQGSYFKRMTFNW